MLGRSLGALALLGIVVNSARLVRKRAIAHGDHGPDIVIPWTNASALDRIWAARAEQLERRRRSGDVVAAAPAHEELLHVRRIGDVVRARAAALGGIRAEAPAAVVLGAKLIGEVGQGRLDENGLTSLLERFERFAFAEKAAGCFADPETGDGRLGCLGDCSCGWNEQCYPKRAALPGSQDEASVGVCALSMKTMIVFSIVGFLGFLVTIVIARAAGLAMAATEAQEVEDAARLGPKTARGSPGKLDSQAGSPTLKMVLAGAAVAKDAGGVAADGQGQ